MAITLLDGASAAVAQSRQESPAELKQETAKPTATQASDIASARVAAKLSGMRVEALSERTQSSTTWANKDGSLTTELTAGPVRFQDSDTGAWRDVNVDLAAQADGSVAAKAHPSGLRLSGKKGAKASSLRAAQAAPATDLVTLGQGEEQITLQWRGGLPAPRLDGTRATYVNAVPGADVVVEATRTGFEQFVELKAKPATDGFSYTLPLRTKGLKVEQQADGSVLFTDKKSKKTAVMPAPVMWDAAVDKVSGEHTRRSTVGLKVVKAKGGVDLVITPDAAFLTDPATRYPVTIDPSTSALGNLFDTYVQQGETVDWSSDVELDFGNPGTKNSDGTWRTARSFITWNTAPIADAMVSSASLSLWNFHSGNTDCTAQPWEVWTSNGPTTASRWSNQPAMVTKMATSTQTKGSPSCSAQPDGWVNADVTDLVQHWANNKWAHSSMGLRATDENDAKEWKRVNSANAASNVPKLSVTYNYRPRTGTKQEAGPPFFSYGGAYTVNTLTPTLRDTFVDANGDKVNGTFQIFDNATNAQVGNVIVSPWVSSGQVASVTVPAGVLTNGKTYKFRTSPYDGAHYNLGWSAWKTFTVDTTAPSAPASIASTDYPSTSWVKGTGQAGVFTVTPNGTDHNWLEWSLDGVTWTKVATGGSTAAKAISVTPPKDGTHTLQVRQVDKADNKSEVIEYTFHAGPGGFVRPAEGERTARRLALVAEADGTKYNAVSFSWRRSEADAWTPIPAGHVTSGGTALTAWPVAMTGGKNAPLVWNATDTVNPDGTLQIKADFTGPNSAISATQPLTVTVDRNASGAATGEIGPGELNLLTGDFTLSAPDLSVFGLAVERTASSRNPDQGAQQEGQASIFGKEWVSGTVAELTDSDYSHLRRISDTAVAVIDSESNELHFTANAAKTAWIPEHGAESLTLTGNVTSSFTLADTEGTVTTFTKPDAAATTWQVSSTLRNGLNNSTITVVSETVTVDGKKLARPKRVIAPTSAVSAATCTATPTTKGCRVLEFVYATTTTATDLAFGNFAGQVTEIRLWSTEPGAATATSKTVQSYAYDASGRLRQAWNPLTSPVLKTEYVYDTAGRVTGLTEPGALPWTFTYGQAGNAATAGPGMLLKVSRSGLKPGTADIIEGTNSTSVVYEVPLTGSTAPYAMGGAADVKSWGQTDTPTDATAVFPGDSVPASSSGGDLASGSYTRANITYMDVSGHAVNTAAPGGHISTTEYDRFGNTVRKLSAGNRAVALGITAADRAVQADLGIAKLSSTDRAALLSTTTVFNENGTRELEAFGPLQRVQLSTDLKSGTTMLVAAGTSVIARSQRVNEYDAGRPTDGSAKTRDQITRVTTGAQVREHPSVLGDKRATATVINWARGLPTQTIKDPDGLAITETTEYDAQGRVIKQRLPGATGTDTATRVTTYWSATGTGACQGRPEWAELVCSTGPADAITGGGSNPSQLPTTTTEYNWWGYPAKVMDTANGVTRTTTTTYDSAGRESKQTITGGLGQAIPEITKEYDPNTGNLVKETSPTGGTITKAYDKLGRQTSYTDADGGTTRAEYDLLNRPTKITDGAPSTVTYTYDHGTEPRGLATTLTDSVAGAFQASYDADGDVDSEKLPGGYSLDVVKNSVGAATARTYTRDSDGTLVYSDLAASSVHGQISSQSGWSDQAFGYDAIGRLTSVEDTANTICTKRTYTFDQRSNRKTLTSAAGTPGADCLTSGGTTTTTHTYDSGDRLVDAGYAYDGFGRTITAPGHGTIGYYVNDLIHQQVANGQRQTLQLDSALRVRSWKLESGSGSTWTDLGTKINHYAEDGDAPRWIVENTTTGQISRNVESLAGVLGAVTGQSGETVLQLSNVHGDVALQLPLDTSKAPTALDSDEYGNPRTGQTPSRYNWHGTEQRSTETPSSLTMMGVRLYNPSTGRFLSIDPAYGGNANAYEYCVGDPVNCHDLTGAFRYKYWKSPWWSPIQYYWVSIKLTRTETRKLAWSAGAVGGILGVIKDYVPEAWKHVVNGMRVYAWYIATSAGYIYYFTNGCANLQGGWAKARSGWVWPIAPTVWKTRC
ncbi:DNRLRE domain-containing protein [Streptomyces sp. bgisy126]|uniref:DNRLRE domain-containing protein n=1 Tax=unclassified Streptomyces TaxID=2593676 RepID=UPI003EB875BB